MDQNIKKRIYLFVIAGILLIFFWIFWSIIRPKIISANCNEIARKTADLNQRRSLIQNKNNEYQQIYSNCIKNAGISVPELFSY